MYLTHSRTHTMNESYGMTITTTQWVYIGIAAALVILAYIYRRKLFK